MDYSEFVERNSFVMNQNGNIRVAAVNPPATQAPQVTLITESTGEVNNGQGTQDSGTTQGSNVLQVGSTMPPTMVPGLPGVWEFWWIPFMTVMILLILIIVVVIIIKRRRSKRRRLSPFHEYEY